MTEHHENRQLNTADIAGTVERRSEEHLREPGQEAYPAIEREKEYRDNRAPVTPEEQPVALLSSGDTGDFQERWNEIQVGFVDEPRLAVKEADALVAELMKRLAELFSEERSRLEGQWDRGDDVSTEDLRLALKRYRSFFNRLLSM